MTSIAPRTSRRTRPSGAPAHAMACMEIWGGSEPIDNAVSAPGIDAWVWSRPYGSSSEGGDVHYVSTCAAGIISRFVLADVSGHGAEAAKVAEGLRTLVRKHINTPDQSRFAASVNEAFQKDAAHSRFATALLTSYFAPTRQLIICNAGHPRPMLYRAKERDWRVLSYDDPSSCASEAANLPLGIIEPTQYHQFAVNLAQGDLVLMVTDGVTESSEPGGRQLGEAGLSELLRSIDVRGLASPADLLPRVLEAVESYRAGGAPSDDVTLMLLHHNASPPPRYSLGERLSTWSRLLGLSRV